MKKLLVILAVFALFIGTAAANPYNGAIYTEDGSAEAPNNIIIQPGETQTYSYYGVSFTAPNLVLEYHATVYPLNAAAQASDMTVTFAHPNMEPGLNDPYMDYAVFTVHLDENANPNGEWRIVISAGDASSASSDWGSASRDFEVPEFPTIALPVAAILGLAFFMQRRKEE
ncbi:PEF-CTERM sorting domain-containing protein [Methanolobus sediminis]|uniref:PEF-CTERM sorting domain-containing protein n=1 Tax=Methanolobus sediminis TaxID=3072978 RepID=A0AA51UNR0_9EURY|nr:PEF-CTERM sorting domain-containing protein [Methanolobus sediminis]WMW25445.1 PEF-CTERM sorting domain-containing protein [Methanolobus sediminis]